jgi:hypothetical protein
MSVIIDITPNKAAVNIQWGPWTSFVLNEDATDGDIGASFIKPSFMIVENGKLRGTPIVNPSKNQKRKSNRDYIPRLMSQIPRE